MSSATNILRLLTAPFRRFAKGEEGAMTIFGLYIFLTMAAMGSLGVDINNVMAARTKLQTTADAAAHAALYARDTKGREDSITTAVNLVNYNMPPEVYGTILRPEQVWFGTYNRSSHTFTENTTSRSAVRVRLARNTFRGNAVNTYLMRLIGRESFSLEVYAIAETYRPTCFREGFVANGVVDLQSNNEYYNGFCIHSNSYVSINQNNVFQNGTIVSMPDLDLLQLPQSGFEKNEGLQAALREGAYRMRIINSLSTVMTGARTYGTSYTPSFITSATKIYLSGNSFTASNFTSGRIHEVSCSSGTVTLSSGDYKNVVIATPCKVKFGAGTTLENVTVISTSLDAKAITAPNGLQVGKDDNCAAGGGGVLMTLGGMDFAADLASFGGQFLAKGNIAFAARASGIRGTSMVAGGTISGTSNMSMGFCGTGMDSAYEANYFRIAG